MPYAGENEKCGDISSIHILENCMKPEWPEGSRDKVTNGSFTTYTIFKTRVLDMICILRQGRLFQTMVCVIKKSRW